MAIFAQSASSRRREAGAGGRSRPVAGPPAGADRVSRAAAEAAAVPAGTAPTPRPAHHDARGSG
ncbi:hypothetical protein DT073_06835 [Microbacterium sp. ABRD28]|nr:hypothetical protein DT073_06835 [Microbacterium sp. ABRD28]